MVEHNKVEKRLQISRARFQRWIPKIRYDAAWIRRKLIKRSMTDHSIQQVGPGGTITGSGAPFQPSQPQTSYSNYGVPEEESEPVR